MEIEIIETSSNSGSVDCTNFRLLRTKSVFNDNILGLTLVKKKQKYFFFLLRLGIQIAVSKIARVVSYLIFLVWNKITSVTLWYKTLDPQWPTYPFTCVEGKI